MKKFFLVFFVVTLVCMMSLSAYAMEDVENHWASGDFKRWEDEGVMKGYGDGTAKLDNFITRAELATMLVNLIEPTETADLEEFSDVKKSDWYYGPMSKACALGFFKGYDTKEMKPNANISRQEAFVVLNRVYKMNSDVEVNFKDKEQIADWAKEGVSAFVENGYVNGYADGTLNPTGPITRAEMAKTMNKSISLVIKKSGKYDLSNLKGNIIVKADNVLLKNADLAKGNICITRSEYAKTIKADGSKKDIVAVVIGAENEKETSIVIKKQEEVKTTGGGTSTVKTSIINFEVSGNDDNMEYVITRSGAAVAKNRTLIIYINGTEEIYRGSLSDTNYIEEMTTVVNSLNTTAMVNTLSNRYNNNSKLRELGMNIYLNELDAEQQAVALIAAVPGNDNKASVKVIFDALTGMEDGLTSSEIVEKAINALDETFTTADECVTLLNQI